MPNCPQCLKAQEFCVCASMTPIATKLQILILQHPQEPKEALSTGRMAHLALPQSTLKVGLSWPNLKAALGREAVAANWAVLYLGSGIQGTRGAGHGSQGKMPEQTLLQFVSKQGAAVDRPDGIQGVVFIDGTWSQAKALWWRNAWLLKLKRAILQPSKPSLYRELRREPRRECLSTIESIAETLTALGEPPEAGNQLRSLFMELLKKQRSKPAAEIAK